MTNPGLPRYDESELGERRGLPVTEFLYTPDQVGHILALSPELLKSNIYFVGLLGRKQGQPDPHKMRAISVTPSELHEKPEWRIPESELVRYMEHCNIIVYERRLGIKPD